MKKFAFHYSALIKVLICLVIAIAVAGLTLNIITVIKYVKSNSLLAVVYSALSLLTALLLAEAVAIAFYGTYKIKDGKLYSFFGFIYSKTDVNDIVAAEIFLKTEKLVVYFKDEKFSVIIIAPEKYQDFIAALIKENPDIKYLSKNTETA